MYRAMRLRLNSIILSLINITCIWSKSLPVISFEDGISRPYGSAISIGVPLVLTLLLVFFNLSKPYKKMRSIRTPFCQHCLFAIFSGIFLLFNEGSICNYIVAFFEYITYLILFCAVYNFMSKEDVITAVDRGFRASLIIQTAIGWLYVFFGILVPYISNYSNSVRNGFSRMTGSAGHPGDFSLYIAILFVYFISVYLFKKEKKYAVYAIIAFVDIFLSGARTMLVVSCLVGFFILIRKYRRNFFVISAIVVVTVIFVAWFLKSDVYQDMFVKNSLSDMFIARFVHWIMGFRITFGDLQSFLVGVGLNSHADYIDAHYSAYATLVATASSVLDSDFVRGMPIHNSYLIMSSEMGIVGFIMYVRMYIIGIRKSILNIRKEDGSKYIWVFALAAFAVFAFYCIQGWAMMKRMSWILLIIVNAIIYVPYSGKN